MPAGRLTEGKRGSLQRRTAGRADPAPRHDQAKPNAPAIFIPACGHPAVARQGVDSDGGEQDRALHHALDLRRLRHQLQVVGP